MWKMDQDILRVFRLAEAVHFVNRLALYRPRFVLSVAYTATVQLPGVSGAGTTAELRELTASADAEILVHGRAVGLPGGVPSNPNGAPGPSIITRAAFDLIGELPLVCINAGLKRLPAIPDLLTLDGAQSAESLDTGQALGRDDRRVRRLFEAGLQTGERLGRQTLGQEYLVLAESVPGGTTTALGVLLALGLNAENRVSSSMPDNAHTLKLAAARAGLQAIGAQKGDFSRRPLAAVAALGDPMQPAVAGLALAASAYCPVVLAGGTQMAAVLAVLAALRQTPPENWATYFERAVYSNLALATTRWVAADPTADLAGLAAEIEQTFGLPPVPYLAANLDFSPSRYEALRLYEAGYVKEGVGAGAAALATMLTCQLNAPALLAPIETVYERIVLQLK